jgi:hypothetical protein
LPFCVFFSNNPDFDSIKTALMAWRCVEAEVAVKEPGITFKR